MERRPLTTADLPALLATMNATEAAEGLPVRTPLDELTDQLEEEDLDLSRDSLGLFDDDGACAGFGWAHLRPDPSPQGRWATVSGWIHPDHAGRGHGGALLTHLTAGAEALLRTVDTDDPPRIVDAYCYELQAAAQHLLHREGFRAMRWFDELTVALAEADTTPVAPEGIAMAGWDPSRSQEVKGVHRGAFADHWGSTPITEQRWQRLTAEPRFQPQLSTLALRPAPDGADGADGADAVVGMVLVSLWPEDWETTGREEAWIDVVGTARSERGRGVARAMLARTLLAAAEQGLSHATLGVDSDSPTGAHRLYSGLGFGLTNRLVKWARPLGDPQG